MAVAHILLLNPLVGETAKKKVLVVDDNEYLLRAWERILKEENCEYVTTTNPQAALQFMEDEGVDILISDIVMPQIDGFDLIQKAQQVGNNSKMRIVLTTGYACDFGRIKLNMPPQNIHVLMKPYNNIDQVENFVRRLIDEDKTLDDDENVMQKDNDVRIHVWSL